MNQLQTIENQEEIPNPRTGRTPSQQVTYRTLYDLARDYIRSDSKSMTRSSNPIQSPATLAHKLFELAEAADWKCHYTGCKLNLNNRDIFKISFDRIDNRVPHTPENMVCTARWLNCVRGDMSYDQWMTERPWELVNDAMNAAKNDLH